MTQPMIQAYKTMMSQYIKNNTAYKTINELNLSQKEFDFVANFIKKHHTNVNVVSSDKCIHIEPKNIIEQVDTMVKNQLYYDYILQNSYIKFPKYH
jgi:hypothetical protein